MEAQKWKENEAAPTWFKNDYDRAYEAANQKAQKWKENEAAPTWLKNGDDHPLLSDAFMKSATFQEIMPLTYAAYQKWQWSRQVAPPTSDGTRPPNEGEESEEGMESDAGAKADADSQQMSRSCGLFHGARTTVTRFWEKGSPEDCIVQDADKAIARPLRGFERLQFKIDPLDKGLYYVTRYGELIDKVTKEKAEEAQKARIQVQKEAEGCLKQMLADTGSIE